MPVPFFPDGADVPAPFPVGYRSSLDRFADRRRDAAPFEAARMPARTGPGGARPDCPALPSLRPDGGDDEKNASNVRLTGSSASRTGISGFSPAKDVSVGQGRICGAVQIPDDALVPLKKQVYLPAFTTSRV